MKYMKFIPVILLLLLFTVSTGDTQSQSREPDGILEISDDIAPYEGSMGPGNPLYGLKIALENLDEGFTLNATRKLEKLEAHARMRIAEAKAELRRNNTGNAERSLEQYREKLNASEELVSEFAGDDTVLRQAQKEIIKHQYVLEQLHESHPGAAGLERALNNSMELEEKFESKTGTRIERVETKDRTRLKIREVERERIEIKARLIDNATDVRVSLEFLSDSAEPQDIAQDIRNKLNLSREDISRLLEIEAGEEEKSGAKERLEIEVDARGGVTEVGVEFRFLLGVTGGDEIIEKTYQKLSALTINASEIKVEGRQEIREEKRGEEQEDRKEEKREERRGD